ncbi:sugar (pentulose or hexulose) kinase [Haloferula luteola]|uniref:Sugar (Pentulose or hexulose) kinase n=1 Tax=Haloferula luteola TaxID=595692 RepID=A0A840V2C5_9BACT|nr:rhamnulokinase family protein [Haloferula luteola]MBB5349824.1 sugar (pentulose or hexulose) kinase [Haloferula luteola]
MPIFIAIDLGAGSGRLIAGVFREERLSLEEVHRFENPGTDLPGGSFWNVVGLFREIQEGLRIAAGRYGDEIVAIGIDTWGCDFALLDEAGRLLGLPHQYRDPRHEGMAEVMHARMPEAIVYQHTGITTQFYNSSLHLLAENQKPSPALVGASALLFVPDLLSYWLCGSAAIERTVASTSQLLDPATGDWAWEVIDAMGLPKAIFGHLVDPGTPLGVLRDDVQRVTGLGPVRVVASASHDTAAAVAGIPMENDERLWLSSGTWSIMGIETDAPIRSREAFDARCCNELGVDQSVRFLKNIAGLWLIQECRRQWALEGESLSYAELAKLADAAEPFQAFIDPDDPIFASPGNMPERIREYCRRRQQPVPEDKGQILRIASESLALKYRVVLDRFRQLTGKSFTRLHAGGGGIQNETLMQATADACQLEIIAGPVEATSCGNLIVQMVATGHLKSLAEGRALLRRSFDFPIYQPHRPELWEGPLERFRKHLAS